MVSKRKVVSASVILIAVLIASSLFLASRSIAVTVPNYNDVASYDFIQSGSTYAIQYDNTTMFTGTNATAVLQSALNSASPLGAKIHVWAGTYNITNTININKPDVEIDGDGRGTTTFLLQNDSNCNMFYVAPQATMFTLRDMELNGSMIMGDYTTLTNFNSVGTGVYVNQTTNVQIDSCYIWNFPSDDVFLYAAWGAIITNSYIEGSGGNGLSLIGCYASLIQGNTFNWNILNGVIISGQRGNILSGNTVYANSQDGILLDGSCQNTAIFNNWINDNGIGANDTYDGIHGNGASFCSIIGNVIDAKSYSLAGEDLTLMERSAIYLDSASMNNTISGNVCRNSLGPEIVGD